MSKSLSLKAFEERADKEGLTWEEKEQFEKALDAYNRLLTEAETYSPANLSQINEKNAVMAYLLMRKAGVLLQTGKVELGEQTMRQALGYAERSNNSLIIARARLGIGVFYGSTNRFEEAEELLTEALSSFGKGTGYDNKQGYGWALLNLGGLYGKQGKWALAEQKLAEAIKLLEAIENWVGVASAYELKAKNYSARGDVESAKKNSFKAISFYEKQGMIEKADSLRKDMK